MGSREQQKEMSMLPPGRKQSLTTNTQSAAHYKLRAPSQNQRGQVGWDPNGVGFISTGFPKGTDLSLTFMVRKAVPAGQTGAELGGPSWKWDPEFPYHLYQEAAL